jgi:hypothetical protein
MNINRQETLQQEYMINKQHTSNIGKCGERINRRLSARKLFQSILLDEIGMIIKGHPIKN